MASKGGSEPPSRLRAGEKKKTISSHLSVKITAKRWCTICRHRHEEGAREAAFAETTRASVALLRAKQPFAHVKYLGQCGGGCISVSGGVNMRDVVSPGKELLSLTAGVEGRGVVSDPPLLQIRAQPKLCQG